MPGPPIRKPSDHSPPAGSPRNIAGHHVLHRPLMPRHPPNAQKNKQQRHTNKTRNTLSQKSYSKMLASTIQFTTNTPTPKQTTTIKQSLVSVGSGPERCSRTPTACHPHAHQARKGHPPRHTPHTSRKQKHDRRVSYTNHQTSQPHPREQTHETRSAAQPFRKGRPPAGPDPFNSPSKIKTAGKPPRITNP